MSGLWVEIQELDIQFLTPILCGNHSSTNEWIISSNMEMEMIVEGGSFSLAVFPTFCILLIKYM